MGDTTRSETLLSPEYRDAARRETLLSPEYGWRDSQRDSSLGENQRTRIAITLAIIIITLYGAMEMEWSSAVEWNYFVHDGTHGAVVIPDRSQFRLLYIHFKSRGRR